MKKQKRYRFPAHSPKKVWVFPNSLEHTDQLTNQLFADCPSVLETLTSLVRSGIRNIGDLAKKMHRRDVERLTELVDDYREAFRTKTISCAINNINRFLADIAIRPDPA